MAGIQCVHCNFVGILENQDILFDGETVDRLTSRCFKYKGHNPFSGILHYECSQCKTMLLVDPMDVMGAEILMDIREKPRGKSFF